MTQLAPLCLILALALAPAACAPEGSAAGPSACQAAADHVASCHGEEAPPVGPCDAAQAEVVLGKSCAELEVTLGDTKSDRWDRALADFSCRLGIYRYCPVSTCDAAADEVGFVTSPSPIPGGASACAEEALGDQGCGACDYYLCREDTARCGVDGYLTRFAYRYCNRYRLTSEPHASPAARAFLERVRRCLIVRFDEDVPDDDCASMWERGFAAHPPCYVESGFCDLSVRDWMLVLATIDDGDVDFKQVLSTSVLCLREWFGG